MLLLLQAAAPAAETVVEDGFSKLQVFLQQLIDWGVNAGGHIISAVLIFIVGRFLISFLNKMVARLLAKRHVVAVIGKLGVETTSFAALLASAGVAIGMALSGNLQNFAGGLIVLLLRPYKVGDLIESQGITGTVREIQIFHTILTTGDNKIIYIPNGALSSGTVTNYSREATRRVEWIIGVEYGENFDKVEETTRRIIAEDKRILSDPAPFVALHALDASSVNVIIRAWVKSEDYWGVYFDMNKTIYSVFNKEGIGFPFPQLTVHQAKD